MLQFNVSLDGNDTMVGGSGGPARPRDHGGGMLITHQLHINYTSFHKRAPYYTPWVIRAQKIMFNTHNYISLHCQRPMGDARTYYAVYYTLVHTITLSLHDNQV